ncbi:MAG: ATP phosphoribosyltransferase [Rhodothermales bacterium]|nr:ATP phosphoribosyltransferase [Rhodothermales bacterium]
MAAKTRLRLAIQKSGRLSDDSLELLKRSGLRIRKRRDRFIAHCDALPIDVLFVRDDDIPGLVMDDVVDLGIVGRNVLREAALGRKSAAGSGAFRELENLDFGNCRVSIAVPDDTSYDGPHSLASKRIATSYPRLLESYLSGKGVTFQTCDLNGAVEIAPRAGLADAICDIVSTGVTLEANGLREVETIFESTAVLVRTARHLSDEQEDLVRKLLTRFRGVISARESKYIMLHAPKSRLDEIVAILPGAEDPTILSLSSSPDKVAVHVVSRENLFWETMEELQKLGATSILVLPIEKMLA